MIFGAKSRVVTEAILGDHAKVQESILQRGAGRVGCERKQRFGGNQGDALLSVLCATMSNVNFSVVKEKNTLEDEPAELQEVRNLGCVA